MNFIYIALGLIIVFCVVFAAVTIFEWLNGEDFVPAMGNAAIPAVIVVLLVIGVCLLVFAGGLLLYGLAGMVD